MIQAYVMVGDRGRVTLPRETAQAMGLAERQWLRLSVLDDGRGLLEHVPPGLPESAISARRRSIPNAQPRLGRFAQAAMIQVYVPVRPGKRITLPTVACRAMQRR